MSTFPYYANHCKRFIIILLIALPFLIHHPASAQWTQTNGPEGGTVNCFARVGSNIWMGTPTGLYISYNEGLSWQKSLFLSDTNVTDLLTSGDTIVLQYTLNGIYCISSFDQGLSWSNAVKIGDWDFGRFQRCQSSLICVGSYLDMRVSPDMGLSWNTVVFPTPLYNPIIKTDGQNILLHASTASGGYHLFISTDVAQTWQDRGSINGYGWLLSDSLILGIDMWNAKYITRSGNQGLNFQTVFTAPAGENFDRFIKIGDSLFVLTWTGGAYISLDFGLSWTADSIPATYFEYAIPLANGDQLFYQDYSLQRYIPSQGLVLPSVTGFKASNVVSLRNCNGKLYCSADLSLYRSPDAGQTWNRVAGPGIEYDSIFAIVGRNDTVLWVNQYYVGLSTDDGLSFTVLPLPDASVIQGVTSIELKGSRIYLSADYFYYSDDWGITWNTFALLPNVPPYGMTGYLKVHQNKLFAVNSEGKIYKYDESAGQWIFVQAIPGQHWYNMLSEVDSALVFTGGGTFTYSLDGGNSWITPANNGLPMNATWKIYPLNVINYQGMWVGNPWNNSVYYTSDHGENWTLDPLTSASFKPNSLAQLGGVLFSGSIHKSVWQRAGVFHANNGKVYRDDNNNGIADPGEQGIPWIIVNANPSGWTCSTDSLGNYILHSDAVGDTLKPEIPQGYFTTNPLYTITTGSPQTQDFGIYPTPGIKDLSIDLTNVNIFHSGFFTQLVMQVKNKGSVLQSPVVRLNLPPNLEYISANPQPVTVSGDTISWQLNPLDFLEFASINLQVKTSVMASIGDTVICSADVYPFAGDTNPADNHFTLVKLVQNSYDPNDKTCEQGEYFPLTAIAQGQELTYTIRFQNTGNIPTEFVRIVDTLSPFLDWSSFRVISSSHAVQPSFHGHGVVEFLFDPLALPPMSLDEEGSMGFVKYGIKCKNNTQAGNAILNRGHIYFDFNPPIQTNTTSTLVADIYTQITDPTDEANILRLVVYPNPASDVLHLEVAETLQKPLQTVIYDFTDRQVLKVSMQGQKTTINTAALPNGFYLGSVVSRDGRVIARFKFIVNR